MPSILTFVNIALSLACFSSFSWAVAGHFRREGSVPVGMRAIGLLGLIGYAWMLLSMLLSPASGPQAMFATIMLIASMAIFWSAISATREAELTLAYSLDRPTRIVSAGIYRHVRHPFYSSYLLFWFSGCLTSNDETFVVMALLMLAIYFRAARQEEAKFASSELADDYRTYLSATGMFIPRFRRAVF